MSNLLNGPSFKEGHEPPICSDVVSPDALGRHGVLGVGELGVATSDVGVGPASHAHQTQLLHKTVALKTLSPLRDPQWRPSPHWTVQNTSPLVLRPSSPAVHCLARAQTLGCS